MEFSNPLEAEKYILNLQGIYNEYVKWPFTGLTDLEKLEIRKKQIN